MNVANPFQIPSASSDLHCESEHDYAAAAVETWLSDHSGSKQVFRLTGFAGTGKTTLAKRIAHRLHGSVCFAAFFGKAASVLRQKGCADASTIHRLIYRYRGPQFKNPLELNPHSKLHNARLLILDEVSNVDLKLGRDVCSFGTPILALGDSAQLPPINGRGFFSKRDSDFELTEVYRQTGAPGIMALATHARKSHKLHVVRQDDLEVKSIRDLKADELLAADQLLAGRNETCTRYTARIRQMRGFPPFEPVRGDKLVCLKNNHRKRLLNGEIWFADEVNRTAEGFYKISLRSECGHRQGVTVMVHPACLGPKRPEQMPDDYDDFGFGYVLTVHKAQGSEWGSVVLFDESEKFKGIEREWLYTGITRASTHLTVVTT